MEIQQEPMTLLQFPFFFKSIDVFFFFFFLIQIDGLWLPRQRRLVWSIAILACKWAPRSARNHPVVEADKRRLPLEVRTATLTVNLDHWMQKLYWQCNATTLSATVYRQAALWKCKKGLKSGMSKSPIFVYVNRIYI